MKPERISIKAIEIAANMPVREWKGNCYGIATVVVESGLVKGRAVYGHFIGKVSESSYFGHRAHHPFIHHGWVQLPDGRIFDPTRWVFEGDSPYIWLGENDGSYDQGGNRLRAMMIPEWPDASEPGEKRFKFQLGGDVIRELEEYGAELVDDDIDGLDYDLRDLELTARQMHWLSNFPITLFSSKQHAYDVFTQIVEHGLGGFIPIDNRLEVLGD